MQKLLLWMLGLNLTLAIASLWVTIARSERKPMWIHRLIGFLQTVGASSHWMTPGMRAYIRRPCQQQEHLLRDRGFVQVPLWRYLLFQPHLKDFDPKQWPY